MQWHLKRKICTEEEIEVIYCWYGFPLFLFFSLLMCSILGSEMNKNYFNKISQLRCKVFGNDFKVYHAAEMSSLILICSMRVMSSGYFNGAEDCNHSPVKVNAALTGLITAEKEEWRGQVDRWCFSMSSVNDALVTLWEELSVYKEEKKPII